MYFAAKDEKELARIYDEIDRLEKSEIKSKIYYEYTERFAPFALGALLLLSLEWLAAKKFLRSLPE
jgi:Ca-activated chloride channel family protein